MYVIRKLASSGISSYTDYKRKGYSIPLLNQKQFKELQESKDTKIVGYTYLKEVSESSDYQKTVLSPEVDSSLEGSIYFKTKLVNKNKKKLRFVHGYADVGEGRYIAVKRKPVFVILLFILLLSVALAWGVSTGDVPFIDFGGVPITEDEPKKSKQENISIPGYFDKVLQSEEDTLKLLNPDENDVYFVYTVSEGDNVIFESKAIAPGNMAEVSLYNQLSKGEHQLKIDIGCHDMKTNAVCNGASSEIKVTVK